MNERAYDDMNFEETCFNDTDDFEETGNTPDSEAAGYMESEPQGRDDGGRTENEREQTAEEENSYPPVKENNGQDDPPEITYYQREGQKGGMLRLRFKPDNFMYMLPLFYLLPKEFVAQRPAYLELPRSPKQLLKEKKYIDMVMGNYTFFELVADSYAWCVWKLLKVPDKKGGYKPIPGTWNHYSEYFPIWKLCYYISSAFKVELHELFQWDLKFLFSVPKDNEAPWIPYERFAVMVEFMTKRIIQKNNLQPTIDCAWEQRQPEDYNGKNVYFRDYQRSWYHNRKQAPVSMDELMKDHARNGTDINGNAGFDIPDPKAEFEQEVVEKAAIDQFKEGLSETDMRILKMRQMRFTLAEIAEAVGFKTASAVKKRIDRIAVQYTEFSSEAAG